jgi:hypothetical protein
LDRAEGTFNMTANTLSSMAGARNRLNLASGALVAATCFLLFHFPMEDKAVTGTLPGTDQRAAEPHDRLARKNTSDASQFHAATSKPKAGTAARSAPNAGTDDKVSQLVANAGLADKQGNSTAALSAYAAVRKLQPGNQEAENGVARLDKSIAHDPSPATNELKSAIRSFYQGEFDEARSGLMDYLESPQTAQNPGAADFYLGATLIERSILRTPQAQWKGPSRDALLAFRQARKANYSPVRAYVSPALLKIWDSTAP